MRPEDIDRIAVELMTDLDVWAMNDNSVPDGNLRVMTLGYISGVTDMAKAIKRGMENERMDSDR